MDYLDVVVHVFTPEMREYYRLEQLWGEAPALALDPAASTRRDGPTSAATAPGSSFGATCFLRLITPGKLDHAVLGSTPKRARHGRDVARDEQVGALRRGRR